MCYKYCRSMFDSYIGHTNGNKDQSGQASTSFIELTLDQVTAMLSYVQAFRIGRRTKTMSHRGHKKKELIASIQSSLKQDSQSPSQSQMVRVPLALVEKVYNFAGKKLPARPEELATLITEPNQKKRKCAQASQL